jgi:hypothetical protein
MKQLMARPLILDGRNLLNPNAMSQLGPEYHGIGKAVRDGLREPLLSRGNA